jgi:transcriptional regulator with XRE-family HTH domain
MAELPETLGDRIARLRRSLGWNQAELADRVGCKPAQVSKYERGAYEPRLATLSRLAAAFGTSTDYLLTGRETTPRAPDQLIGLWPALERLPLALRNEIAGFLKTVVYAQALLGLSDVARQRPRGSSGPAHHPAKRGRRNRAKRSR